VSEWTTTRLDRVATVKARIGWKALTADEYQDDGYVFLNTPNIKGSGIDFEDVNYIGQFRWEESPELQLRIGDVLLAKDGSTLGITNVVTELPRAATVNGSIAVVRPHGIDPKFLRYSLASAPTQSRIEELRTGMGVPHLFQWDINRLPVAFPAIEEQRRIADFLDDQVTRIDGIISARRGQQELISGQIQAEVDSMLDLESRRGTIRAARLVSVVPGFAFPSSEYSEDDSDVRLLRGVNVGVGSCRWEDVAYWPARDAVALRRFRLNRGDIVLGMDRPWIRGGLRIVRLGERDAPSLLLQRVAKISPVEGVDPDFIVWAYRGTAFREQVEADLTGLSVPHLSGEQILDYGIPAVPYVRQVTLSAELNAVALATETQLEVLTKSERALAMFKESLIAAALTGELDVTTARRGLPV